MRELRVPVESLIAATYKYNKHARGVCLKPYFAYVHCGQHTWLPLTSFDTGQKPAPAARAFATCNTHHVAKACSLSLVRS